MNICYYVALYMMMNESDAGAPKVNPESLLLLS